MSVDEFVEQKGIEKGREESNRVVVQNLLKRRDFPVEEIASVVNVSVEFVNEIKSGLIAQ
jgi:hypothetical protein